MSTLIFINDQKLLKKGFLQDLNSGFWIPSSSCQHLNHRTFSDLEDAYNGWVAFSCAFFGLDRMVLTNFCVKRFFPRFFFLVDRFPSESLVSTVIHLIENQLRKRSTESWTRVFGFQVQGADHYTFQPTQILRMHTFGELPLLVALSSLFVMIAVCSLFGFFLVLFPWLVSFLSRFVKSKLQQWSKLIEKWILARFELGFLNSEFKLLASKP